MNQFFPISHKSRQSLTDMAMGKYDGDNYSVDVVFFPGDPKLSQVGNKN